MCVRDTACCRGCGSDVTLQDAHLDDAIVCRAQQRLVRCFSMCDMFGTTISAAQVMCMLLQVLTLVFGNGIRHMVGTGHGSDACSCCNSGQLPSLAICPGVH
jgi:hypothetical protein